MFALPFTTEQFMNVFVQYNTGIWPAQIGFYLLAIVAVTLTFVRWSGSNKAISLILGFFWIWMGAIFHLIYSSGINPTALLFGPLCVLQGALFLYTGAYKDRLTYKLKPDLPGVLGAFFIAYALVIYPLIGYVAGHVYPAAPVLSAPCPTTIFTFGLLLGLGRSAPKYMLVIPLLWSIFGTMAVTMGIYEDVLLLVSGVVTTVLLLWKERVTESRSSKVTTQDDHSAHASSASMVSRRDGPNGNG